MLRFWSVLSIVFLDFAKKKCFYSRPISTDLENLQLRNVNLVDLGETLGKRGNLLTRGMFGQILPHSYPWDYARKQRFSIAGCHACEEFLVKRVFKRTGKMCKILEPPVWVSNELMGEFKLLKRPVATEYCSDQGSRWFVQSCPVKMSDFSDRLCAFFAFEVFDCADEITSCHETCWKPCGNIFRIKVCNFHQGCRRSAVLLVLHLVDALLVLGSAEIQFLELSSVISVSLSTIHRVSLKSQRHYQQTNLNKRNEDDALKMFFEHLDLRSNVWREVCPQGLLMDYD